tara:strand:+ start:377 stop:781 length:405 start_codon:yes stop_codon:yes gene_type:complete
MRKLIMLILMGMMSLNSFSQNVIDSTSIQLKKPIVRLVIKDLITGDSFKKELNLITTKYSLLENKVVLKDSVINNLNFQINNFNSILDTKGSQLEFTKQLNDKLRLEIKKQKIKNKILGGAGLVAIGGVILILK